ncbi:hypothetical protein GTP90_02370 [Rugamonas sp. FT81W]|uniref:Uncharacterized protein n=2 Tax=Duganella vulcania TaxID=2692166 RepID=A0A845GH03_9BURK|nr:hypothetical protein [Duganella vulcania]
MFSKVALVVGMMFAATAAQAGIFGSSERIPTPQELQAETNCSKDHSVAYCTFWASGFRGKIDDVDLPGELRNKVDANGSLGQVLSAAGSIGIGASQLAGAAPTIISKSGMGSLNIVGGLMLLAGGTADTTNVDKMIAFLPESEASDPETAGAIIENAYVDAFVKAVPGVTSATYETFMAEDGFYVSSFVLHGGDCDTTKCVLFSNVWGNVCKYQPCNRPKAKARLIHHGYLGQGKFWAPPNGEFVTLVINPVSHNGYYSSFAKVNYELPAIKDKLELMTKVSQKLPQWASYFLGPSRDKTTIPCPMVLQGGTQYLFVKPSSQLAAN